MAARTMGPVERRDGRRCGVEGARPAAWRRITRPTARSPPSARRSGAVIASRGARPGTMAGKCGRLPRGTPTIRAPAVAATDD
jgi:hypothetical protein